MKLIDQWHKSYELFVVQVGMVISGLSGLYEYFPQVRPYLDPGLVKWAGLVILIARVIDQGKATAVPPVTPAAP